MYVTSVAGGDNLINLLTFDPSHYLTNKIYLHFDDTTSNNRDCQVAHWKVHKMNCKQLKESYDNWNRANTTKDGKATDVIDGPCAICLEDQVTNPVSLDCGHVFCFTCLGQYQLKKSQDKEEAACPNCRGDMQNVPLEMHDRGQAYFRRALNKPEGSVARKRYAELAAAEYESLMKIVSKGGGFGFHFLWSKMKRLAGMSPEEVLRLADDLLSNEEEKLDELETLEVNLWKADAYLAGGKHELARQMYNKMKDVATELECAQNMMTIYRGHCRASYELGDYDGAIGWGEKAIQISRHFSGNHRYVAMAHRAKGDIEGARKAISRGILYEQRFDEGNMQLNKQFLNELNSV